ncbi:MAG: type II toxin-antitoxin system RelE/ParE family toxin [Deltaproteobacteria bacterium]|nr:type II toxin-antitoxin system RelE/ParE family toxin [Deltaproteobacteria bacterium]
MIEINKIIQSPLFVKQKKRLHKNQIKDSDKAVREITQDPEIGTMKTGDLSGVRVYKFKSKQSLILLAYEIIENSLFLYTFGSHQNFYQELKKYINP